MENEKITCAFCGAAIDRDNATETDIGLVCEECIDNHFLWCDHCERYTRETYTVRTGANRCSVEDWCNECVRRDAILCDNCGNFVAREEAAETRDGMVCTRCYENEYCYCEECGETVHSDHWNASFGMCDECTPSSRVVGYHGVCTAWPRFREGNERIDTLDAVRAGEWFIGAELEIDRADNNPRAEAACTNELFDLLGDRAAFERDGSLHYGFEIVIRPHTLRAFVEEFPLADVLDICRRHGYTSHDAGTCGLHFHISREFFGDTDTKQERAIGKCIAFYDRFFDDLVRASRRGSYEARRWANRIPVEDMKQARKKAKKGGDGDGRYLAVNTENAATAEFRLMRGTLREASFRACLDLVVTLAANARRLGWDTATTDPAEMLKGITPETVAYLTERAAFLPYLDRVVTGKAATVPAAKEVI